MKSSRGSQEMAPEIPGAIALGPSCTRHQGQKPINPHGPSSPCLTVVTTAAGCEDRAGCSETFRRLVMEGLPRDPLRLTPQALWQQRLTGKELPGLVGAAKVHGPLQHPEVRPR